MQEPEDRLYNEHTKMHADGGNCADEEDCPTHTGCKALAAAHMWCGLCTYSSTAPHSLKYSTTARQNKQLAGYVVQSSRK